MKVAYIGGTFDLFHVGHIELLSKCAEVADRVVVALNTDEFCAEYKRKPVISYENRRQVLLACGYVDMVVRNVGGYDSKKAIDVVDPDIIVHGDDWTGEAYLKQLGIDENYLHTHDIELVYFPYTKGISTTEIIKSL